MLCFRVHESVCIRTRTLTLFFFFVLFLARAIPLVRPAWRFQVSDLVIVHEHRGEPDGVVICHLPFGPTASFSMSNVVMRHDIPGAGTVSEA